MWPSNVDLKEWEASQHIMLRNLQLVGVMHNYQEEYLNVILNNGECSEFDHGEMFMTHYLFNES